jgi:hypothetical protein
MRKFGIFVVAFWGLVPFAGSAQTKTRLESMADFYERTGHPQSAVFFVQLQKAKDEARPATPLDQLIAEALKQNPDIRVAESKVRETEAELNRTRMKVVSEVTFLHAEIQAAQAMVDYANKQHDRMSQLKKSASISEEVYREAALALEKAKADLAAKQAKLPYLLGRSGNTGLTPAKLLEQVKDSKTTDDEFLRRVTLDILGRTPSAEEIKSFKALTEKDRRQKWIDQLLQTQWKTPNSTSIDVASSCIRCHEPTSRWAVLADSFHHGMWLDRFLGIAAKPDSPLTDKLRKALDTTIHAELTKAPQKEVMDFVRSKTPGVNLIVRLKSDRKAGEATITANFRDPIPLGAFLQYLEDELGCSFVLRDYGVVVVSADEKLPPGAVRVIDFWKRGKSAENKIEADKTPAPKDIRAKIDKIDEKDGNQVSITVGSDAGLQVNHMLGVYRTQPQPKFVGTIRIISVTPQRAVGRVVDGASGALQVGDEVTSQLTPDDRAATK